jgi:hypothetical protein
MSVAPDSNRGSASSVRHPAICTFNSCATSSCITNPGHCLSLQVWVLDALPGEVRSADMGGAGASGGADRPADLISTLQAGLVACLLLLDAFRADAIWARLCL